MNRADPPDVGGGRTRRSAGRSMQAAVAVLVLLLGAVAAAVAHAPEHARPQTTHTTAAASLGDLVPGPVVVPAAQGHPMHATTWLPWIPADLPAAVALLASALLAVAGLVAVYLRSQAPPPGRGPPRPAFPH